MPPTSAADIDLDLDGDLTDLPAEPSQAIVRPRAAAVAALLLRAGVPSRLGPRRPPQGRRVPDLSPGEVVPRESRIVLRRSGSALR